MEESWANGTRIAYGCDTAIRGVAAKTAVVILMALADCGNGQHPDAETDVAARATPDRWTDRHGNVCESLEPGPAWCRTPDGHVWYREYVSTTGSLARNPVEAMMWMFLRGHGDVADGLSPDIPAAEYAGDPHAVAIAEAARRLVEWRKRWLNPPERVEWGDEPVPAYPARPVARNDAAAKELKARPPTSLYNARPQWLSSAAAVGSSARFAWTCARAQSVSSTRSNVPSSHHP